MGKISAVFTDLDGTVLRNDKTISERTMEAFQRFQAQGGIWTVASARPERAITVYKELADADAMYFGDDVDDLESIRQIGRGIAMGNAIREVKDIADFVTATNEEDGVAQVLETQTRT